MESAEVDLLFPTPVYRTKLDLGENLKLIQNYIDCFDYYYFESNKAMGTVDQNILKDPFFKKIKEKIEDHLNHFLFDILKISNLKVAHSNSWLTKFQTGDFSFPHQHSMSFYSGVLYLKVPDGDCGDIIFHKRDEHNTISSVTFGCEFSEKNILNSKTRRYKPEEGLLLIFPSHLDHSVTKNNSQSSRYSLAFNYFIDGNFGVDTQRLNIKVY